MLEGYKHGLCFSKEQFLYMKIKMARCFQNGRLEAYASYENLSKTFKVHNH